jgi:tryptophanyl-tRNA synthetase
VEAPKDPETAPVFLLYRHLVGRAAAEELAAKLRAGGTGWAAAKQALFEALEAVLGEARERYRHWMSDREGLEAVLRRGAERARALAAPRMETIRRAVGVR